MKKLRDSENQIIQILNEAEVGKQTADLCQENEISPARFYEKLESKAGVWKVQKSNLCVI